MRKKKQKQARQIMNYLKFVTVGIVLLIIVALVSGCGSRRQEGGSCSEGKKILSKAEIQELTDLVVVDADDEEFAYDDDSDYEEDEIEWLMTEDSDSNSHYTYIWGDKEEEDSTEMILAQVSTDHKVLQTFSTQEIELYSGKKEESTEFLGATDQELIFESNLYLEGDGWIWYRIPLSYENGQEKVLCDKKEVLYKAGEEEGGFCFDAGNYFFCSDEKSCFTLDRETKEKQEIIRDDKNEIYGYCDEQTDPWISSDGNACVVLKRYRDALPNALYSYHTGKQKVQEITEGITAESRIVSGDGQVFYTGLVDGKKQNDYNLYVYDMELGVKRVLASEEEIRAMLPEKPSKNADFIRELVYAQGTLYLEIRYADQCCVLSCAPDRGTLTFLEGIKELVRHKEYHLSEPIKNGNNTYSRANDHNIFETTGEGVVERTLDGAYVRTIYSFYGAYDLLYVNNRELICEYYVEDPCGASVLYSIPLTEMDGNDYPEVSRMVELTPCVTPEYAEHVQGGGVYANEDYLVYMKAGHSFAAYDRKKEEFINIAGLPQESHSFSSPSGIMGSLCGDYVFFNAKPENRNENKWGFSLYHFGDSKVTSIDPLCWTSAQAVWCQDGKTIVYECQSETIEDESEICTYDIQTGKKTVLFRNEDLYQIMEKHGIKYSEKYIYFDMYVVSDQLYLFTDPIFEKNKEKHVIHYDLGEKNGLEFVEQSNECLKCQGDQVISFFGVAEGKLFMKKSRIFEDEEGDEIEKDIKYYYYDLQTGKSTEFGQNDSEYLYLSLL